MTKENKIRLIEGAFVFVAFLWAILAVAISMLIINDLGIHYWVPTLGNLLLHAFGISFYVKWFKSKLRKYEE